MQATAVTGTFSEVTLHDDKTNTAGKMPVYYSLYSQGIFSANPDGSNEKLLVPGMSLSNIVVSSTGSKIYYLDNSNSNVYWVSSKGGAPTAVLSGVQAFALSPSNAKIAYATYVSGYRIYVANIDTSSPVWLDTSVTSTDFSFLSETRLAYRLPDAIYRINTDGTSKVLLYDNLASRRSLRVSPDFRYCAWLEYSPSLTRNYIRITAVRQDGGLTNLQSVDPGFATMALNFSGDSRSLLITANSGVYQAPVLYPSSINYLFGGQTLPVFYDASYGRNPTDRTIVGAGAPLGTQLSAFIYALRDSGSVGVSSFVGFDAVTPSSVTVTPGQVVPDQRFINFTVEADQFTKLSYAIDLNWNVVSGLKSGSLANGAIVTLDSTNGSVASVATYRVSRNNKPQIRNLADRQLLVGDFLNTFDRAGVDHGPRREVELR